MPAGQDVTVHFRAVNRAGAPACRGARRRGAPKGCSPAPWRRGRSCGAGSPCRPRCPGAGGPPGCRDRRAGGPGEVPDLADLHLVRRAGRRRPGGSGLRSPARRLGGASGPVTFRLDGTTGELQATVGGEVAVRELWPDVGPPFPGGHKAPVARRIEYVTRPAVGGLGCAAPPTGGSTAREPGRAGRRAGPAPPAGATVLRGRGGRRAASGHHGRAGGASSGGARWLGPGRGCASRRPRCPSRHREAARPRRPAPLRVPQLRVPPLADRARSGTVDRVHGR